MSDSDTDEYEMDNQTEQQSNSNHNHITGKRKHSNVSHNGSQSQKPQTIGHNSSDSDGESDHNDDNGMKTEFAIDHYMELLVAKFKKFAVNDSNYEHVIDKCKRLLNCFMLQKPEFLESRSFYSFICRIGENIAGEVYLKDIMKHHNTFIKILIRVLRGESIKTGNHEEIAKIDNEKPTTTRAMVADNNGDNNNNSNTATASAAIDDNNINNKRDNMSNEMREKDEKDLLTNIERNLRDINREFNAACKRLKFDVVDNLTRNEEIEQIRNDSHTNDDNRSLVSTVSSMSDDISMEDVSNKSVVSVNNNVQQTFPLMSNGIKKSVNMAVVSPVPVASSPMALVSPVLSMSSSVESPVSPSIASSITSNDSHQSMDNSNSKITPSSDEYTDYPDLNQRIDWEINNFINPKSHWYKEGALRVPSMPIFFILSFVKEVNEQKQLGLTQKQINDLLDPIFKVVKRQVKIRIKEAKNRAQRIINID